VTTTGIDIRTVAARRALSESLGILDRGVYPAHDERQPRPFLAGSVG
jgi:hypothetical protein